MIITLVIFLASIGFSLYLFRSTFLPMINNANKLMATGAPGSARVLSLEGTGTLINNAPQVVLGLEIHPSTGGSPFVTRCVSIVSQLKIPQVQPGCMVPVRFDPMNPQNVALAI